MALDFSKFSDAEFDTVQWINEAFKSKEATKNKEQHCSNLVTKLQLFIQEVNKSLDEISVQIVQTLPKVARDIESINQEALLLKTKMESVQRDVQTVEQSTADTMESLLKLDTAKSRMLEVEKSLKEIDNWSTLSQGIDEVFESGSADAIASKLLAMQQSLTNLSAKSPEYASRSEYLDQLKDHFINIVSPSIVASFSSKNLETVQYFIQIFGELGKTDELQKYYQRCLKADTQRKWTRLVNSEESIELPDLINTFHDAVLSSWYSEMKWCGQALKSPNALISESLTLAISDIDPAVSSVIADRLVSYPDQLCILVAIKQNCENFARSMESAFVGADVSRDVVNSFLGVVYQPFSEYLRNYRKYQQSDLLMKLNTFTFESRNVFENLRNLKNAVEPVFTEAFVAVERCQSLTNCLSLPGLLRALEVSLTNFIAKAFKVGDALKLQINRSEEDWTQFQQSFELVQISGHICACFKELEERLQLQFSKVSSFGLSGDDLLLQDSTALKSASVEPFETWMLTDQTIRGGLTDMEKKLSRKNSMLPETQDKILSFNINAHKIVSSIMQGPLLECLKGFGLMNVWVSASLGESLSADLPSFSLAPQEYITKVGQYLMTFAHYMEPFLSEDDKNICLGLSTAELPFADKQIVENSERAVAIWIEHISNAFMHFYSEAILNLSNISETGCKQLLADLEYFCNVIEDLGLSASTTLRSIKALLRLKPEEYAKESKSYPLDIVNAVKEMRRI